MTGGSIDPRITKCAIAHLQEFPEEGLGNMLAQVYFKEAGEPGDYAVFYNSLQGELRRIGNLRNIAIAKFWQEFEG